MLQRNVPLSSFSNMKIGGPASYFSEFSTKEDLIQILSEWESIPSKMDKILVLGEGTNILFNDAGYDGLVIKNSLDFIKQEGEVLTVGAGTAFSRLLDYCIENSLSGLEWAGGLPGSVGGAIRGNAGAYGGETKDNLTQVESIDIKSLEEIKRNVDECKFGYRDSIYKQEGKEIILSAKFHLKEGNKENIEREINERKKHRQEKHPLEFPNLGSTFKNTPLELVPQVLKEKYKDSIKNDPFPIFPTTKLLALAGIAGKTIGGAKFSEKHPNFIVNINNAKSEDVIALINFAKKEIMSQFNIPITEEILIV